MPIMREMVQAGIFGVEAKAANGLVSTGLSGAGTSSQANAYPITTCNNVFTTVALNSGAVLPATAEVGDWFSVVNFGANPLLVYPPVGQYMHNQAVNTSFSVAANKAADFFCYAPGQWFAMLSA